ncbi:DEAD/DEAH box helicase [Amycolatopsis sp. VS8301801F10]|uniref:DEAD/DEAH box helicase n=1 Tax=unclassified Amycolatopsis TaxID=2618356 RepID=UPI0038FC14F8
MAESSPSLVLAFDQTRTRAELRAQPPYRESLASLMARFPGGRMVDRLAAQVPIDEFLAGLEELANWPEPATVVWEENFRTRALALLQDAERSEEILAGDLGSNQVSAEDVPGILGSGWTADLTEFQRRDIAKLLSLGHGANFSVPGAGKTRVALAVFSALREQRKVDRVLVVSPKSAYEAWVDESQECFGDGFTVKFLGRAGFRAADLLIVNYERLGRSLETLADWLNAGPALVILDEAHRMKLGTAGVYGMACMSLAPLSKARLILTGTPAPNGARDLESLLAFVWPGRGRRVVSQAVEGGNLDYASRVLKPMYARTTKQELGLPPVSLRVRTVDMPPLHREIYDALLGQFASARAERSRSDFDSLGRTVLRMIMAATSPALLSQGASRYEPISLQVPPLEVPPENPLYELLGSLGEYEIPPKYQEALAIVAGNAAQGRKTLVWASFVRSITTLESLLADFSPAVVHGGTPERQEQIDRFRTDPACQVLISNPATLGEGISLHQVCHDAVYVDRDFQAGRFLQSLDRIHRLGLAPDAETNVTILTARETIDEVVAMRLNEKLDFMGRILDDSAVQQLGDPDDEPAAVAGMDSADVEALMLHIAARQN